MAQKSENLDTLRAFAVSVVLISHLPQVDHYVDRYWLDCLGHAGVLAFFVHTSLVLMFSMDRLTKQQRHVTLRFYLSRIFRIYPLAIATIILIVVLQIPDPRDGLDFHPPTPLVLAANLLLVQNVIGGRSVIGPLWSLPFEVQMYVLLPLLYFVATRANAVRNLAIVYVVAAAIGLTLYIVWGKAGLFNYAPCFVSGVLAFALSRRPGSHKLPAAAWGLFLVAWFVVSSFVRAHMKRFDQVGGWVECLLLGVLVELFRDSTNVLWNRCSATIAKYSYGIYLLHMPVLYFVYRSPFRADSGAGSALTLLGTALLSFVAFHVLEDPLIKVGKRLCAKLIEEPGAPA